MSSTNRSKVRSVHICYHAAKAELLWRKEKKEILG